MDAKQYQEWYERAVEQRDVALAMYKDSVENFDTPERKKMLWDIYASFRTVAREWDRMAQDAEDREAQDVGFGYMGRPM